MFRVLGGFSLLWLHGIDVVGTSIFRLVYNVGWFWEFASADRGIQDVRYAGRYSARSKHVERKVLGFLIMSYRVLVRSTYPLVDLSTFSVACIKQFIPILQLVQNVELNAMRVTYDIWGDKVRNR